MDTNEILLPQPVVFCIDKLRGAGYEVFAVGGCVRDRLRGVLPNDYDLTTNALPADMQRVFSGCRVIETGLKHGTLTVLREGMPIEITTYRVDGEYADHRHPDEVIFTANLADDLARRDFTVNAMAYSPDMGVIDLYGGKEDLKNGIIRCVGEPSKRFDEDGLRILRALRFASVLDFEIDPDTSFAARLQRGLLEFISRERIREELCKLLTGKRAAYMLGNYSEIWCEVFKALSVTEVQIVDAAEYIEDSSRDLVLRLALLAYAVSNDSHNPVPLMHSLKFDNAATARVKSLLEQLTVPCNTDTDLLRIMRRIGREDYARFAELRRITGNGCCDAERMEWLAEGGACYTIKQLAVDGNDLRSYGIAQGSAIGEALELLLEAVITNKCPNEHDALLRYIGEYRCL